MVSFSHGGPEGFREPWRPIRFLQTVPRNSGSSVLHRSRRFLVAIKATEVPGWRWRPSRIQDAMKVQKNPGSLRDLVGSLQWWRPRSSLWPWRPRSFQEVVEKLPGRQWLSHEAGGEPGLVVICRVVCSCIYCLCLLFPKQSEMCVCMRVCLSVCVCVCVFAVPPRGPAEDWEFSVSVRRRILAAAALLILSLLILCCCSEGSKKIEALAVAAGT